jgi:cation transport protein ChaC
MSEVTTTSLWVFGYGSLVWKPGFQPGQTATGYVNGFARRFWQGNETHRGVPGQPGRVATIVEEKEAVTHGVALELKGEEALEYLNNREMTLGGYIQTITTFVPIDKAFKPFPVLVFVATAQSRHWLGPACSSSIAKQVVNSAGPSGHNVEYVIKLAHWLRKTFPEYWDDHLYSIESHILDEVKQQDLDITSMLGTDQPEQLVPLAARHVPTSMPANRPTSYSSTCQQKCLKCVRL